QVSLPSVRLFSLVWDFERYRPFARLEAAVFKFHHAAGAVSDQDRGGFHFGLHHRRASLLIAFRLNRRPCHSSGDRAFWSRLPRLTLTLTKSPAPSAYSRTKPVTQRPE